jgi:hypothetical protein
MSYRKYLVLSVFGISLAGCGANSSEPRQSFAKSVVDTLATYLQLQTQKTSEGKPCLEGWGRNDIPVNSDQTQDFLNYKGIFNHD